MQNPSTNNKITPQENNNYNNLQISNSNKITTSPTSYNNESKYNYFKKDISKSEGDNKKKLFILIFGIIIGVTSIINSILSYKKDSFHFTIILLIDIIIILYSILISFSTIKKSIRYTATIVSLIFLFIGTAGNTLQIFLVKYTLDGKDREKENLFAIIILIIMSLRIALFLFVTILILNTYRLICCKKK